ncbi:uncharacterized protein [Amphiura filiformis]|uniref:uncharacterized protein isoform X1 n=1 Tax=Amphiura filiformis TaxID=82378 RepID=UPI003B213785
MDCKVRRSAKQNIQLKFKVTVILLVVVCVFGIFESERLLDSITSSYDIYEALHLYIRRRIAQDDEEFNKSDSNCQLPRLDKEKYIPSTGVSCQRPPPIKGSCDIARHLFFSEPTPTCSHQTTYDICRIKQIDNGGDVHVSCSITLCKKPISIGIINETIGSVYWNQTHSISHLEDYIKNLLTKNESNGNYGFCFLKCSLANNTIASQLLLLPQNITKKPCKNNGNCRDDSVNINVVWLDSTSHSHFYRSMPKTVQTLRDIKESGSFNIFNYNSMQSLLGGTYVNIVAFTAGQIYSRTDIEKEEPGIGNLFKLFQDGGYHVSMIDDLCWSWSVKNCACGTPTFMGVKTQSWISDIVFGKQTTLPELWGNFNTERKSRGVDDIGASLANCEIMKANGITNPFFTAKVPICYNGLHQNDYLMSSVELLQSQLKAANTPHFTYLDLNQGHEASGRRIQTLDASLAKFMSFLSRQDNTLTLMFGDHGNSYGPFIQHSKEAKIEMANPVLFVLASNDVATKLGRDWMHALDINQHRLVNILDLRQTVLSLAPNVDVESFPIDAKYDNHPNGLFHPISRKRSCDSMGIPPKLANVYVNRDGCFKRCQMRRVF